MSSPAARDCAIDLAELHRDPYPTYRRLREQRPVAYAPEVDQWLVTRWDDVLQVEDASRFSADLPDSAVTRTIGVNMMHSDGQAHRRLREAVAPVLRPGPLRSWVEAVVPDLAARLLAPAMGQPVDLVAELAEPLPAEALGAFIGLEDISVGRLRDWFTAIGNGAGDFVGDPAVQAAAGAACADVDEVLAAYLTDDRTAPAGSLLAWLLGPGTEPRLTADELGSLVKLIIIGGMQESRDLIATTLAVLGEREDVQAAVRAQPRLVSRLIEESLRWSSPVGTITRRCIESTYLGGVQLPAGATVAGAIASANRDDTRWSCPDHFDLWRDEGAHLAFARGVHACVGAGFGRLLARVAVSAVLDRCDHFGLERPVVVRGWEFRGPVSLLARLT